MKIQPSFEQRTVLLGLIEEQKKEPTATAFANRFLPFGISRWSQICDALDGDAKESYFDKISPATAEKQWDELAAILDDIPQQRASARRLSHFSVLKTSKITALAHAVLECRDKPGEERLVQIIGHTGAGKTMGCNFLASEKKARVVQVNETWRQCRNEFIPLADICRAVGMRPGPLKNPLRAVDEINWLKKEFLRRFGEKNILICFDEGEHFGRSALNLLKWLLNETRVVPCVFLTPRGKQKWYDWFGHEADQLDRRTHAVIEISVVEPHDAALFFPDKQFHDARAALLKIAHEASNFGHYSLVRRVAVKLEGVSRADDSDVTKAIAAGKLQMHRGGK